MADENTQNNQNTDTQNTQTTETTQTTSTQQPDVAKLVAEQVAEQLKEIKGKLDGAFSQRDEALRKVAEFEEKERLANIEKMKAEGKLKEAHEAEMAAERAKRETAEKRITELTRDNTVRAALGGLDFRNEAASNMAYQQIINQFVQNDQGEWVHKSGASITDFVSNFAKDTANEFLFKPKVNSGGGTTTTSSSDSTTSKKSLFSMTQAEVLALAAEGKL